MKPKKQKPKTKWMKGTTERFLEAVIWTLMTVEGAVSSTLCFLDENYLFAALCLVLTVLASFCCVCEGALFFLTRKKDEIDSEEKKGRK